MRLRKALGEMIPRSATFGTDAVPTVEIPGIEHGNSAKRCVIYTIVLVNGSTSAEPYESRHAALVLAV